MGIWWIAVVLAAGCLWWWLRRRARAKDTKPAPRQGVHTHPDASESSSKEARVIGHVSSDAPAPASLDAGSPVPAAPQTDAVGVTKTEVMCALRADVPNGFRRAQELLIAARRYLKDAEKSGGQLPPAALEPMRQACHALAAALGEDGWMPAEEIAGNEAAAINAFLQRFGLAFENWQGEYALLRQFLPQL